MAPQVNPRRFNLPTRLAELDIRRMINKNSFPVFGAVVPWISLVPVWWASELVETKASIRNICRSAGSPRAIDPGVSRGRRRMGMSPALLS